MQSIHEEDALPILLGSRKQRQFLRDKVNAFGMPKEWEAYMPGKGSLAEMKASKQAVPEPLAPVAEKKQPKAKPQSSAAEQTQSAASPTPQDSNEIPCGPASEAFQEKVEAFPHRQSAKTIGNRPQARIGFGIPSQNHLEWGISASAVGAAWVMEKAQKELMAAVARNDAKTTEELLAKFGPSTKLGLNWPLTDKVCKLLLQGDIPVLKQGRDIKKGGLVKHVGKELPGKSFKDGLKQFRLDEDLTVSQFIAKENQAAARLGRSASVPHLPPIAANTSQPRSVPKRSVSNTRIRRKPMYQSDA
jgi:hypothetical protein